MKTFHLYLEIQIKVINDQKNRYQIDWESRNGSFFSLSFPNQTVQAITKGLVKCVLRVKTYLRSTATKEFVVDSDAKI